MRNRINFEQYKKDQAKIEKIPVINDNFISFLEQMSVVIESDQELNEKQKGDLEIVYEMTQSLEPDLVAILDGRRSSGAIDSNEYLLLCDFFLFTNQQKMPVAKVKQLFLEPFDESNIKNILEPADLSPMIKNFLISMYKKL